MNVDGVPLCNLQAAPDEGCDTTAQLLRKIEEISLKSEQFARFSGMLFEAALSGKGRTTGSPGPHLQEGSMDIQRLSLHWVAQTGSSMVHLDPAVPFRVTGSRRDTARPATSP